jgi:3',5'-cyclic AMP phosphodiesterase CpdA
MRTLVHLSDLHFGRVDKAILQPLIEAVHLINPDVVAISGDLTQRARTEQFQAARAFLDALPSPKIIVPGNHDISAHNLLTRFLWPLDKYRRYITDDLQPFYADEEIAIMGVNTARSLVVKGGRINEEQIARVSETMGRFGDEVTKIVVTHHPFDLPEGHDEDDLVGRARLGMKAFAGSGVDLLLAGHLHLSHTTQSAIRYNIRGYSAILVQAGTATSMRGRGEANSFNVIRTAHPKVLIERHVWQAEQQTFRLFGTEQFLYQANGWTRALDKD